MTQDKVTKLINPNNSGRLEPAESGGETEEAAGARAQTPAVRAAQGTGDYWFLNT